MKILRLISRSVLRLVLLAALAASASAEGSTPAMIGVAGGVCGKVEVFTPRRPRAGLIVESGKSLFLNDVVVTGPGARLQILLNDETVFTLGSNSSMTLDEFFYDPAAGSGKLAARIIRGVFRFVSGRIAHHRPSDMTVRFPTAILSVRGTIVVGRVDGTRTLAVLLGPGPGSFSGERAGAFALENAGVSVLVGRPRWGSHVDGPGLAPSPPAPVAPMELDGLLGALASLPVSDGGDVKTAQNGVDGGLEAAAGGAVSGGIAWPGTPGQYLSPAGAAGSLNSAAGGTARAASSAADSQVIAPAVVPAVPSGNVPVVPKR